MNCIKCKNLLQHDHKFCPYCGTPAKLSCHACGKDIQAEWVTCPYCGVGLKNITSPPHVNPHTPPNPSYYRGHSDNHYYSSSSGQHHRRKKGLLERFFS